MRRVYLALGSNVGDSLAYLSEAVESLDQTAGIEVEAVSALYQTAPYGPVAQDDFLNAVVRIQTSLAPLDLLDRTQSLEATAKRSRAVHWGPRTLDIDLIYDQAGPTDHDRLQIPHPESHKRLFVLCPLADVWQEGDFGGKTLAEWIQGIDDQEIKLVSKEWRIENAL